jgi:hypothetical protein
MVTELLVWALVLKENPSKVVDIYSVERICLRDAREAYKVMPDHPVVCVPRRSMQRPKH